MGHVPHPLPRYCKLPAIGLRKRDTFTNKDIKDIYQRIRYCLGAEQAISDARKALSQFTRELKSFRKPEPLATCQLVKYANRIYVIFELK